jgi:hypothetical protein
MWICKTLNAHAHAHEATFIPRCRSYLISLFTALSLPLILTQINITVLSTAKCPVSAFLGCPVTPRICGVTVAWELIHSLLPRPHLTWSSERVHRILACLDYQTLLVQQCCTFSRQVRCPRILLLSTNTDFLQWKLGENASLTAFNALYSPPHPSNILPAPVYQVACDS